MKNRNYQADPLAEKIIKICRLYESLPADTQDQIIGLISFVVDTLPNRSVKSWLAQFRAVLQTQRERRGSVPPI